MVERQAAGVGQASRRPAAWGQGAESRDESAEPETDGERLGKAGEVSFEDI